MADDLAPNEMGAHCPGCDGSAIGKSHSCAMVHDPEDGPLGRRTLQQCSRHVNQ